MYETSYPCKIKEYETNLGPDLVAELMLKSQEIVLGNVKELVLSHHTRKNIYLKVKLPSLANWSILKIIYKLVSHVKLALHESLQDCKSSYTYTLMEGTQHRLISTCETASDCNKIIKKDAKAQSLFVN